MEASWLKCLMPADRNRVIDFLPATIPRAQPFHLTDYQQPVLSLEGLSLGSVLHVAMGQPGQLSLPGKEIVSFQPHPKTLTMAGDYEYFAAQVGEQRS